MARVARIERIERMIPTAMTPETGCKVCSGTPQLVAKEIDPHADLQDRLCLWLLQHPFQSVEDIALAFHWHPSFVYRQVRLAVKSGLVDTIAYQCHRTKATSLFYLAPRGLRLVAHRLKLTISEVAWRWQQRDRDLLRWLPRLQGERMLQQMVNRCVESWCDSSYSNISWEWVHRYVNLFNESSTGDSIPVADAVLTFSTEQMHHHLLFLLDPGYAVDHDEWVMQQRVEAMLDFRDDFSQRFPGQDFSPILLITPSERNLAVWSRVLDMATLTHASPPPLGAMACCAYDEELPALHELIWTHLSDIYPWAKQLSLPLQISVDTLPGTPFLLSDVLREGQSEGKRRGMGVKGNLMQRSLALTSECIGSCREQEVVALLGLRLHRRHLDILRVMYQYPWRNVQEIAAILYITEATVRRSIRELIDWQCVSCEETPNGNTFRLRSRGRRFMAAQLNIPYAALQESLRVRSGWNQNEYQLYVYVAYSR
jgi:hypothetical protein